MIINSAWYSQVFLRSKYWEYVKAAVLDRDDHRCRFCGSPNRLHVHHLSYYFLDKLVQEKVNPNDYIPSPERLESEMRLLITLCDECHTRYHNAKNSIPEQIKKATDEYNEKLMAVLTETFDRALGDTSWANIRPAEIAAALKVDVQRASRKAVLKGTNVNKSVVPEVSRRRTQRVQKRRLKRNGTERT